MARYLFALICALPTLAACATTPARAPEPVPAVASEGIEVPVASPVAAAPTVHLSRFAAGDGPRVADDVYRLLDEGQTHGQSNAMAFDRAWAGTRERLSLRCRLRLLEGGDGGAIAFLDTAAYGVRGPAPFVPSWVEPNLRGSFAVGFDVHNPHNEEPFGPWGNYQNLPQREVSLHWDGREIVKRVAPHEFRGDFADCEIVVQHVIGGAEVTVRVGAAAVYDRYFVAGLTPYEPRLAFGATTRDDAATEFDVTDIRFEGTGVAKPPRAPTHVEVFNHVLTDNSKTAYVSDVMLPPLSWEYGRVTLTLEVHDGGPDWDEWDRNGEVSIITEDGTTLGIVPFITSFRTPCHWEVDVTHFRPWLAGKTRFEVRAGTTFYENRGYMMSVTLDFHHGRPALEPYRVVPLWLGTAHYKSTANHFRDFFTERSVDIDETARSARVFMTTTGHSQVGEFTASKRTLSFVPAEGHAERRFENVLLKTDCYLNPNRPQFGTWKYSRAGWAPGDVVWPWWIDLTPDFLPGKTATFRYEPQPYDFSAAAEDEMPTQEQLAQASHVVRSYLVLYRPPGDKIPAPTLKITRVAGGTNAAKAGAKKGDYLASYDGKTLYSIDDLRAAIAAAKDAGKQTMVIVIYRGSERLEMEVGPGKLGVGLSAR